MAKRCGVNPLVAHGCVRRPLHKGKHQSAAEREAEALRFLVKFAIRSLECERPPLGPDDRAATVRYLRHRLAVEHALRRGRKPPRWEVRP